MSNTEPLSPPPLEPLERPVSIKRPGRPKKTDIEAKKKRNAVGRPPGEAARIKEFYARLLSTSGDKVIETVLKKALDDTDKDQVACLKMCMDRLLPLSYFEKDKVGGAKGITINISGLSAEVEPEDNTIDAEDVEVKDES